MAEALWTDTGGDPKGGAPLLVLLHGLGANAGVWEPTKPLLAERWPGAWIAPDLRGHGRSPNGGPYGYAAFAADVASAVGGQDRDVVILGHSMGGVVAMALATGWFGVSVSAALAFGVKIAWADGEAAKLKEFAKAPAKVFDDRAAAMDRYLKVSGLIGLVDPDDPAAASGITETDGGYRLAADNGVNAAAGPDVPTFYGACAGPVRLAAGETDPMCRLEDMQPLDPDAVIFDGLGHNCHVERPDVVWDMFETDLKQRGLL